jgi:hypothetical protein
VNAGQAAKGMPEESEQKYGKADTILWMANAQRAETALHTSFTQPLTLFTTDLDGGRYHRSA